MNMFDLYIQLKNTDMPWFDLASDFVRSHKNVERMFLEQEVSGETHLYLIHGYRADGQVITWYELRNKATGESIGPDSHYGLIDAGDLEAHVIYCRLLLDDDVYSDDIDLDDLALILEEPAGAA